jgi:hypothetical protein
VKSTSGEMFVINYKKSDIQLNSRVFAGICWKPGYGYSSQTGDYDIKLDKFDFITIEDNDLLGFGCFIKNKNVADITCIFCEVGL